MGKSSSWWVTAGIVLSLLVAFIVLLVYMLQNGQADDCPGLSPVVDANTQLKTSFRFVASHPYDHTRSSDHCD